MHPPFRDMLYPELKLLPADDRVRALRRARRHALDAFELIGIAAGLILGMVILRDALWDNPSREPGDLVLSAAVICLAVFPFFMRRTRRGLKRIVASQSSLAR